MQANIFTGFIKTPYNVLHFNSPTVIFGLYDYHGKVSIRSIAGKNLQTTDHTIDMWHDSWQRSLKKIETMDVNDDQTISVTELNRYLLQDGIIYERYLESISDYERCRAAAMLTFLIRFQKKPKSLKHYTKFSSNGRVDIFRFPQCDNFMTVST